MAEINIQGVDRSTGKNRTVRVGDTVTDADGNPIAGLQGDTGIAGVGSTGIQGDTGISLGSTGIQGDTGVAGIQGITGISLGETGIAGIQGDTGISGLPGVTGLALGDTGIAGIQGDTGIAGIQGVTGIALGATGISGTQGDTGIAGIQGDTGTGIQGATGITGETGIQGDQGVTGLALGATGLQGTQGSTGVGGGGSVTGAMRVIRFTIGTAATTDSVTSIPSGARIQLCSLQVTVAYDAGTTIAVGRIGFSPTYMTATQNTPQALGTYTVMMQDVATIGAVRATITGTPTTGAGIVTVWYAEVDA